MYHSSGDQPADMVGLSQGNGSISDLLDPSMMGSQILQNFADVDMTDLPMGANNIGLGPMGMNNDGGQQFGQRPFSHQARQLQQQTSLDPSADDNSATYSAAQQGDGIGAGPLPTGFGIPVPAGSGSTLTEFTKRRNWSRLVLEETRDLLLILSPDSRIQYASPSCKLLTGYEAHMLVTKFLADFIHIEDRAMFLREFNGSIASGNQMRFFYRFLKENGSHTIFEAHGHPHLTSENPNYATGGRNCRGVFMMSRPYPTKNAALLDSFLEHKIENERLTRRIAELKREEQEEQEQQEQQYRGQAQGSLSGSGRGGLSDGRDSERTSAITAGNYDGMPPPAKPSISNVALTRQNLDEALASHRPDSINDKMARYEGATHIETIEMLTGLRYRDGERSEGISTGATSPALIRGDIGIPVLADRDRGGYQDKKKKVKVADEYVCTDCGTLDSPEWRKGPNGPKTLCNARGLRWAKKEKKRQSVGALPSGLSQHQSSDSQ